MNAKKNPNFATTVKFLDLELPEQVKTPEQTYKGRFRQIWSHCVLSTISFPSYNVYWGRCYLIIIYF